MAAEQLGSASMGWHRVCLNTIVRKGVALDSERLRILPMGSRVHVVEKQDRRVRIDQPIAGWCSLKSSNGDTILTPLDKEEVSTTTPAANATGRMGAEQEKWTQRTENYKQSYSTLNERQQALLAQKEQAVSNVEIQNIANELKTLKEKVEEHQTVKKDREMASIELAANSEQLKNLQAENEQHDTSIQELTSLMEQLRDNLHTKSQEAGVADPEELAAEIDMLEREKHHALEKVAQADSLAQAARNEMDLMRQQMQTMFGANYTPEDPSLDYEDGDVVLGKEGLGIVVVRWVGEHDGEMHLGVETSDPVENGFNGQPYFNVEDGKGLLIRLEQVKKKLTPETLLNQLHEVLKQVTRTRAGASE